VKLQHWVKHAGLRVVLIFEGRDAAGKGGVIKRILEPLNPRGATVVALGTPSDREKTQWYFQRYIERLPAAGEIVLFDRSWYNRAGVEPVMGFCTPEQHKQFLTETPRFEKMIVSEHGRARAKRAAASLTGGDVAELCREVTEGFGEMATSEAVVGGKLGCPVAMLVVPGDLSERRISGEFVGGPGDDLRIVLEGGAGLAQGLGFDR
jgi:hypothetical protein